MIRIAISVAALRRYPRSSRSAAWPSNPRPTGAASDRLGGGRDGGSARRDARTGRELQRRRSADREGDVINGETDARPLDQSCRCGARSYRRARPLQGKLRFRKLRSMVRRCVHKSSKRAEPSTSDDAARRSWPDFGSPCKGLLNFSIEHPSWPAARVGEKDQEGPDATGFCLLLIFTLSALSGPTLAGPLEDGEAAFDHKDYTVAIGLLRPLADQGDADAQTYVGLIYDHGYGVPQNYAEAVSWYRKAADQGTDMEKQISASCTPLAMALRATMTRP